MIWKRALLGIVILALVAGGIIWQRHSAAAKEAAEEPEIETTKVERKDLTVTVSASGVIEPLTKVEVKSRTGGEIARLFVEAGDTVRPRQLIAQIDPTQTKSKVDQAAATVASGCARAAQARLDSALQQVRTSSDISKSVAALQSARANVQQSAEQLRQEQETSAAAVRQAEAGLNSARARLAQAEAQAKAQPELQSAELASARAQLESARQNAAKVKSGARPQEVAEAQASVRNAEAAVRNTESSLARQRSLLDRGFVSRQAVEDAQRAYEQAVAQRDMAQQSLALVQAGNRSEEIAQAEAQVAQAEAALRVAQANQVQVSLRDRDVEAAREAVREATAALATAQANRRNVQVRQKQLEAAQASVRQAEATLASSRGGRLEDASKRQAVAVAMADLRKQTLALNEASNDLSYTNVYAPRGGVIMEKFVEEGTVIPAGTAALKEGTGLVSIADTSKLYVLAEVDEADMAGVRVGQQADITASVLPDQRFKGHVVKIFPLGTEEQSVVHFQVRVQVDNPVAALRPGMTADATIKVAHRKDILVVADSAIKRSKGKASVEVLVPGKEQPEEREIQAGISNWEETEVLSGLKEGEEVIIPPPPGSDRGNGARSGGGRNGGGNQQQRGQENRRRMMMQFRMRGS